ncbi:aldo/keto reductase [Bradyrhizobium sp. AUGA SZCCT0240]|nr:aldo/keto reductase [Bradyrhizobium sp. AUGA SZCCT0160]MBR1195719.1 aldo/keto reductase [Bradyrhizobium sp. AUGA SZCCT0158]MBR1243483.1 aldo/keto reductase [Bradyrhizobium sp. AUGA SZCCT0274]MBR1258379.1 aldo/keto reductase [Bradyrhizobium sp. AUGA SZCCT0240]
MPAQVALAWLLKKSPAIVLIPGTSSLQHLEQNIAACDIELSERNMQVLDGLGVTAGR